MPRIAIDLAAAAPAAVQPVEASPPEAMQAVAPTETAVADAVVPELKPETPKVVSGAEPDAVAAAVEPPRPARPAKPRHRPKAEPAPAEPPPVPVEQTVTEKETKSSEPALAAAVPSAPAAAPSPAGPPPDYLAALLARLNRYKEYPHKARLRHIQGRVLLWFALDRSGRLVAHRIARSSGHDILDAAATAMIQRAAPLPPLPESIPGAQMELVVPVDFSLR